MIISTKYIKNFRLLNWRFCLILMGITFVGCQEKPQIWEKDSSSLVITDYVISNDNYSEFLKLLEYTGLDNFLRIRGPYTLLVPTNDAVLEYYQSKNLTAYTSLSVDEAKTLVINHIFNGELSTGTISPGKLLFKNGLGDYVACDLIGTEIVINKTATITKRDVKAANGYVHEINKVLEPITESVFDVLSKNPDYSIFVKALNLTGLADTLDLIEFPYGNATARTGFTILAIPDTLFGRKGISSIDDLIATYSDNDDYTNPKNGLYLYMSFHCLSGIHYFSDFVNRDNYYIITNDNYVTMSIDKLYKINKTADGYTSFYEVLSNIPAKNGTIHTIDNLFSYAESEPTEVTVQTTDFFDLQQGSYYLDHYQSFYDGENTFKYIKWDAEYLMYYIKPNHNLMDDDCLKLQGHFTVQITTPKIRKGKYTMTGFLFFGGGYAIMKCYVDDEYIGIVDPTAANWGDPPITFGKGEVEFTETKQHSIKLVTITPGGCFWDFVRFTPVK
jgi:uncharacterized surface protein with fasciclin (FAS1) repeats